MRAAILLALAGSALVIAAAVLLASSRPRDLSARARAIESTLRCPTCQATSVADSPAQAARQIRQVVEQQVRDGRTDEQIRGFFADRYGTWILLDPPTTGPDIVVWILPAVVVVGGVIVLVRHARHARQANHDSGTADLATRQGGPRLAESAVFGAMVLALLAPIPAALGLRPAGAPASGGAPSTTPTIAQLEAWVAADPSDARILTQLGDALLGAGDLPEAASRYRAALTVDPAADAPKLGLAAILIESGRPDVAVTLLDGILGTNGASADALFMRMVANQQLFGRADARVRADAARFLEVAAGDDVRRTTVESLLAASDANQSSAASASPGSPAP